MHAAAGLEPPSEGQSMAKAITDPGSVGIDDIPEFLGVNRDAVRRMELARDPDLTYLFWECTLKCNLRCTHCGSSCEPTSPLDELSTEEIVGILDTIHEDFDTTRMAVAITGGEPLMRPDLYQMVAKMTGFGMQVGMVSNATLLTKDRAKKVVDAGMNTISISVDGPEDLHDVVRGEGSLAKTLAGITAAREAGIGLIEAITCVRPANLARLDEVERVVRDAGATDWRLITIDRMGRVAGEINPEMWLHPPQVREMFDFIGRRRAELEAVGDRFDVRFSCGGFLGVRREFTVRPGDGQCFAGLAVASILCDGQVSACPSLPRSYAQGSAREQRFSTIWREQFKNHRSFEWRKTEVCDGCSWFNLCLGGGLHERLAQPDCFCWIERQREAGV
jgi:radical SAM protein with 4Fe4S-binding SPASM domain